MKNDARFEIQRQKAKATLPYAYASMLCVQWGRSLILPILKFYLDRILQKVYYENLPHGNRGDSMDKYFDNKDNEVEWRNTLGGYELPFLAGIFYIAYGGGAMMTGYFANRFGRRFTILFCVAGMTIGFCGQAFSRSYRALLFWRAFSGLYAGVGGICQAYINDVVEIEELPYYTSLLGKCWGACWATGPLLSVALKYGATFCSDEIDRFSFALFIASGINAIMFIVAFVYLEESANVEELNKPMPDEEIEVRASMVDEFNFRKTDTRVLIYMYISCFCVDASFNAHHVTYSDLVGDDPQMQWKDYHLAAVFTVWGMAYTFIQSYYPAIENSIGAYWCAFWSTWVQNAGVAGIWLLHKVIHNYMPRKDGYHTLAQLPCLLWLSAIQGAGYGLTITSFSSIICQVANPLEAATWLGIFTMVESVGCASIMGVSKLGEHIAVEWWSIDEGWRKKYWIFGLCNIIGVLASVMLIPILSSQEETEELARAVNLKQMLEDEHEKYTKPVPAVEPSTAPRSPVKTGSSEDGDTEIIAVSAATTVITALNYVLNPTAIFQRTDTTVRGSARPSRNSIVVPISAFGIPMITSFISNIAQIKEDLEEMKDLPLKDAMNEVQPHLYDVTRSKSMIKRDTANRTIIEDPEYQPILPVPKLEPIPEKKQVNIPVTPQQRPATPPEPFTTSAIKVPAVEPPTAFNPVPSTNIAPVPVPESSEPSASPKLPPKED